MADHHMSLDRALAQTRPAGEDAGNRRRFSEPWTDGEREIAELAAAISDPHLPPEQAVHPWGEKAERVLRSDWLAAHDAQVAATAEVAAGERIAKAIEAEAAKYPRSGGMGLPTAARIARADRGSDRG